MRSAVLTGLLAATLLAAIYAASQLSGRPQQALPAVTTEALARLFASRLDDVHGKSHPFSRWQGKTLVVNFWATWCPPCRDEMPAFSRLQDRHLPQGVQFVGIALDTEDSIRTFAETYPVSYPLLIGGAAGVELARQLGNTQLSLPYTLVISPQRELLLRRLGPLSESELERILQQVADPLRN